MRTANNVFHLKCFTCVVCGAQLKKGEQYVVKQGQLFCRNDYEKEVEMLKGFNGTPVASVRLDILTEENPHFSLLSFLLCTTTDDYYAEDIFPSKIDGRRGPKRPRTILNTQQRRAFKASFDISPKPCRKVRENLAKETGLSLRIVQVSVDVDDDDIGSIGSCARRSVGLVPESTCQSEKNPKEESIGCEDCCQPG